MKTLSDLLREADPLGHEPNRSASARRMARQGILDGPRPERTTRRSTLAAVISLVLVAMVAGSRYWPRAGGDVVAAVRFEVRLAEENPAPGLREAIVAGTSRKIYLHEETVVTNSDVAEARVVQEDAGSFSVALVFSTEGAAKVSRASEGHLGRPMAILIDGEVVMAPTVRARITTQAKITGNFTRAEVERIVAGIVGH